MQQATATKQNRRSRLPCDWTSTQRHWASVLAQLSVHRELHHHCRRQARLSYWGRLFVTSEHPIGQRNTTAVHY